MPAITEQEKLRARQAITLAKKELDRGDYSSIHMANYVIRDLEATRQAGLSDLAWAMDRGNLCKNDVLGLIEHLEKFLDSN